MILALIAEARGCGARLGPCCSVLELDVRTVQRWLRQGPDGGEDRRHGPNTPPTNKLSDEEREQLRKLVTSPEFVDLAPHQIVPKLADMGIYIPSESSIYRELRRLQIDPHRGRARPPTRRRPDEHRATGPNQVWCWDITYLRSPISGAFYYLYLFVEVWSRKIVGWDVLDQECNEAAAELFTRICAAEGLDPDGLVLHSENGGPMKGATMLATLQRLGVVPSFSRPSVSDDNAFVEGLFRTGSADQAIRLAPSRLSLLRASGSLHSCAGTTRNISTARSASSRDRHAGVDAATLAHRHDMYQRAKARHPSRWSGATRNWTPIETVILNHRRETTTHREENQHR